MDHPYFAGIKILRGSLSGSVFRIAGSEAPDRK
jgi:hypothetical protein